MDEVSHAPWDLLRFGAYSNMLYAIGLHKTSLNPKRERCYSRKSIGSI